MKKLLCIGVFAAALLAPTPARAGEIGGCKVDGGIKIYLNIQTPPATLPLAPWYLYYPAEAQSQPAGPAGYFPNWAPQPPPGGTFTPPAPTPMPSAPPQPVQQTGYYTTTSPSPGAPSYWYAR
jgi:hypothetical protein